MATFQSLDPNTQLSAILALFGYGEFAMAEASARCPVCGMDTPHAHTKASLAAKYREEWLRAKFENELLGWFVQYKHLLPGSYGMGIHLTRKSADTYDWWPVQMIWRFFRHGASLFEPPFPDGSIPDVNEALEIKHHPFGREYEEPRR